MNSPHHENSTMPPSWRSPKSPEFWGLIAFLLALIGMLAVAVGGLVRVRWLTTLGLILITPSLLVGALLGFIAVPLLIVINHYYCKRSKDRQGNEQQGS